MALFVTHAPLGRVKPHVRPFLEALAGEGVAPTVIVATDDIQSVDARDFPDFVDGLYLRQNQGYDFAAWAHVAQDLDLSRTQSLFLINDSIIGPLNSEDFSSLFSRIRASPAELIGLTDSLERTHHLQSYFIVAKQIGVAVLRAYLADVPEQGGGNPILRDASSPIFYRT
jgi:lipopolysaccharide biosynthesis protein